MSNDGRTGRVTIRDFDQGVVETLGAQVIQVPKIPDHYYLVLPNVDPPPGLPGVPVVFSLPEEEAQNRKLPYILIRRDDITPAMERWHPGTQQYMVAALGAAPQVATRGNATLNGFDSWEWAIQADPYDIYYTIFVISRHQGAPAQRTAAQNIINAVARVYRPYCQVVVKDSEGDTRTYDAVQEGISESESSIGLDRREIGFRLSLRVLGELDMADTLTAPAAYAGLKPRTGRL